MQCNCKYSGSGKTGDKKFLLHFCSPQVLFRVRSQIPVVGVTGRAPDWPGALKLPGTAIMQTYNYYTPERHCVTCVTNFWIFIISIHTSRFGNRIKQIWQPLLFINGYLRMEYTLFQDFAIKIPRRRRRPAAQAAPSQAVHRDLATGPCA